MDYLKEYRRFITSHYLSDGIRITVGIALPAIVLGFFGELQTGIAVALGAMCVSSTDIPGPIHHRKNGMLACLFSIIAVAGLTGLSSGSPTALGITITVFCFVFCMIGVFGARAISVGVAALLIMVLSIGRHFTYQQLLGYVAYIGMGGLWYMLLSLLLYSIRPHKLTQQALGEYISNVARYLRVRGAFYSPGVNYDEVYSQMLEQQIVVEHNQNLVSELLFKSRSISKDSTPTGRILMMIFLDMTDLYERTMMAVHDYRQLHQRFDDTGILQQFQTVINNIADELDETGLAVQSGIAAKENEPLAASVQQLKEEFIKFRNERRTAENLEELIGLFHILQNIEDISTRLNTVKLYTSFDTRKIKPAEGKIGYKGIVNSQNISWQVLRDNLSIHSNIFRHALRVSIATLAGYIISRFLSLGHSYWILLTIIVILKPTYSLTRKRNAQRLWGTASGAVTGLMVLYFIDNKTALFVLLLLFMTGSYSFVRSHYTVAVFFITAWVLIVFHLLYGGALKAIFMDRLVDTGIGSVIAYLANLLIVPAWEKEKIKDYMLDALEKNILYFKTVAGAFAGKPFSTGQYKRSRQHAFVTLANLSDAFTRMLSEPKYIQYNSQRVHRFVVLNHTLTSHIATLAHYVKPLSAKYASEDFASIIEADTAELETAKAILNNQEQLPVTSTKETSHPINERIDEMLHKRKQELTEKLFDTETRKSLRELKPVVDQFNLISGVANDLKKVCKELAV